MKKSKNLVLLLLVVAGVVAAFSYKKFRTPKDLIPPVLLDRDGKEVSSDRLSGKYVGLYFSASYCPPCRIFTPELIHLRNQYAETFEVVLVGSDYDNEEQQRYMDEYQMPWLAIINESEANIHASESLDVETIPYLVILDPAGKVVREFGTEELFLLMEGQIDFWKSIQNGA